MVRILGGSIDYNYVLGNPVMFIDPDGRSADDVVLTGNKKQKALNELQKAVGDQLTLSMNSECKVDYKLNTDKVLTNDAQELINAIDDNSIIAKVGASDNGFTSDGDLRLGNMMGAEIQEDGIAIGKQEINPEALGKMDQINGKPGYTTLQETLEAYSSAKLAQSTGKGTGPASYNDLSFYNQVNKGQSGKVFKYYYKADLKTPNPPHNPRKITPGTGAVYYSTEGNPSQPFHLIKVNDQQIQIINKKHN